MEMTVSAYVEPVTAVPVVNESPQVNEPGEIEESSSKTGFAEILAGMLNKTEEIQSEIIPSVDFAKAEINLDGLADESVDLENLGLLGSVQESLINPENYTAVLHNVEQFLIHSEIDVETEIEIDTDDSHQNLAKLIDKNNLPEADLESGFSINSADKSGVISQTAASVSVNTDQNDENSVLENKEKKGFQIKDAAVSKNDSETLFSKETKTEKTADPHFNPQNEKLSKLDEVRDTANRRSRRGFSLEVRDLRTAETAANNSHNGSFSAVQAAAGRTAGDVSAREITLELRLPENNGSAVQNQAQTAWEAKSGAALENMLARELHQNFNGDIVRHASMALRDGGEGTIKIALKPENLGNVKIHLEMTENKITGRIIVESEEALNAFRREIASLEQAFRDSGFLNADLNLSMNSGGQNAQGWEQENSFMPKFAAQRYDNSLGETQLIDIFVGRKTGSINMLA